MPNDGENPGISVYFLLPKGKNTETCSGDLIDAFETCTEHHLNQVWISEDQAFKMKPSKTVSWFHEKN